MRWHPKGPMVWALGLLSGLFGGLAGNQGGLRAAALSAFRLTPVAFVATATAIGVLVDAARTPVYLWRAGPALRSISEPTNTGENILFTKQLLAERHLDPRTFILVQKPYMERRSYATFRKLWPEKELIVTSPRASLDQYLSRCSHETLSRDDVISIMVGDLQRIKLYPGKGFQIHQDIPDEVWDAYAELVEAGYDKHLLSMVEGD